MPPLARPRAGRLTGPAVVRTVLVLAVLAAGCSRPGGPGGAKPLSVAAVRVGFGAARAGDPTADLKAGEWTPVVVSLTVGPAPVRKGEYAVVLECQDNDNISTATVLPVGTEPAGGTVVLHGVVKPGGLTSDVTASVRSPVAGRPPLDWPVIDATQITAKVLPQGAPLCLALGAEPRGLRQVSLARLGAVGKMDQPKSPPNARPPGPNPPGGNPPGGNPPGQLAAAPDAAEDESPTAVNVVTDVAQLPTRWYAYAGVDLVVMPTSNEKFLSALLEPQHQPRRDALLEWVRRGGQLLAGVHKNQDVLALLGQKPEHRDFDEALPAAVSGTTTLATAPELAKWVETPAALVPTPKDLGVARLTARGDAETLCQQGKTALIVQRGYGCGRVTLVAFDPDLEPFISWPGQHAFWARMLLQSCPQIRKKPETAPPSPFAGATDLAASGLAARLENSVETFAEIPVISFGWVALFIFLYILAVGPLDYYILKKVVRRLELTWVTFPVLVILVSALAYVTAYALKGDKLLINKIDVVDVDLRGRQLYGTTWLTVFSPRIQEYTLGLEPAWPAGVKPPAAGGDGAADPAGPAVLSWFSRQKHELRTRDGNRSYEVAAEGGLKNVPLRVWSTKSFTGTWHVPLDPGGDPGPESLVEAALSRPPDSRDRLRGRVTSRLPAALTDTVLFYAGKYFDLQTLEPNEPREVAGLMGAGQNLSRWFVPLPDHPRRGFGYRPRNPDDAVPADALLKTILFYDDDGNPNTHAVNTGLERLDQGWRLRATNRGEAVLYGRLAPVRGPAEEVSTGPAAASRLWVGRFPGDGPRPPVAGTLSQETFVRVFIPVRER